MLSWGNTGLISDFAMQITLRSLCAETLCKKSLECVKISVIQEMDLQTLYGAAVPTDVLTVGQSDALPMA